MRPTTRFWLVVTALVFCLSYRVRAASLETQPERTRIGSLLWHTDYEAAYKQAERDNKLLFIFFRDKEQARAADRYVSEVLAADALRDDLRRFVRAVLPLHEPPPADPMTAVVRLIDHAAFRHQHHRQGIVVIDLVNPDSGTYGHVVSAHPFSRGKHYTIKATHTVLGLPPGSITQRAMIYAIRMHPEHPRSTHGRASDYLLKQAGWHSNFMARIGQVGHHHWNSRFQQITSALGGMGVSEVAAVGSGRTLIEAARDCVNAWRQSPGHWAAVRGLPLLYGYDLKKGADGQWYATGIFGEHD